MALTTHYCVGREVRDAIERIGGIAPEDLPPEEENINDVKNRLDTLNRKSLN